MSLYRSGLKQLPGEICRVARKASGVTNPWIPVLVGHGNTVQITGTRGYFHGDEPLTPMPGIEFSTRGLSAARRRFGAKSMLREDMKAVGIEYRNTLALVVGSGWLKRNHPELMVQLMMHKLGVKEQ